MAVCALQRNETQKSALHFVMKMQKRFLPLFTVE
jgi:hypothetical protein